MTPEQASKTFPWFRIGDDGIPELYCDHSMLSTLRLCTAKFMCEYIQNIHPKGRNWSLEFGSFFHICMEDFYNAVKDGVVMDNHWLMSSWLPTAISRWSSLKMDEFKDHPAYKRIGGIQQVVALLTAYHSWFGANQERFRVVAVEVPFGRNKEVPIQEDISGTWETQNLPCRCYLCGRIDLLMDDGSRIGPMDHKTRSRFTGDEATEYNPHEGMTGYIYACRSILDKIFPVLKEQGRLCDSIWINHISLQYNKDQQFKRSRITKTAQDLEDYKVRQLGSFKKLWDLVINEVPADYNTMVCHNIYWSPCPMLPLHERGRAERPAIFDQFYSIGPAWDCYNPESKEEKQKSKVEQGVA